MESTLRSTQRGEWRFSFLLPFFFFLAQQAVGKVQQEGASKNDEEEALSQFEETLKFVPKSQNTRISFSLEEANLTELVRVIAQLTGKRFVFGSKLRDIKATIYAPGQVTVAEAYQAFLSILETNGLTLVPQGRFLKIVETAGITAQLLPTYKDGQMPPEDRYVTRLHRLSHLSAEEVAQLLTRFKSKDADITVYNPSNLLILTDTGTNIRRMMDLVEQIDVGQAGEKIWLEPIHYANAKELITQLTELLDLKGGGKGSNAGGDLNISKIVHDGRTNSLILVATEAAYLRTLELLKRLDVPQNREGEIRVVSLQHADAIELTKTINELMNGSGRGRGGSSRHGPDGDSSSVFESKIQLSADKATNSLVVHASPSDFLTLNHVIRKLDISRRQVFIDAAIMDLSISRNNDLGIDFHGAIPVSLGGKDSLFMAGLNPMKTIFPPNPTDLQGLALGLRGPTVTNASGGSFIPGVSVPGFGAAITALSTSGDTDVLSTPNILATDNETAEISVGENIALQQASGGVNLGALAGMGAMNGMAGLSQMGALGGMGFQPQRQDVGTKIKITPHLNESDEVRIDLEEEISEAKASQGQLQVVDISKRTANTKLVVRDQQTVVIGGLMRNNMIREQHKIPLLGDIPLLGMLFRRSTTKMVKTNLVLVLTPYIIRNPSDMRAIFERKMNERQQFLDRHFVFDGDSEYEPPKDYTRTNGLLEDIRQTYLAMERQRKEAEETKPKEIKAHVPTEPLSMPTRLNRSGSSVSSPSFRPTSSPSSNDDNDD